MVLTSRFPYPLEKGDKLRIYHQIKGLAQEHEIILCALTDKAISERDKAQLEPFCREIHVFRLSKLGSYWRVFWWFVFGRSIQLAYFTNSRIKSQIEDLIFETKPDHIYCQLVRMAEYVRDIFHVPKSIDYMDAFSKGMERQAGDSPFPLSYVFNQEAKRLKEYESRVFFDFQLRTIISEQDRSYIHNPFKGRIQIVPNGVDTATFNFKKETKKTADLLFVGNMSYYPNVKAAEFLVENIKPILEAKGNGCSIEVAGANPATQVLELQKSEVKISGWVDDIVATYHGARIFVAPLFHGSGLQNKILEAMACGVPVITTTQTNNAIRAKSGEELLIADDANEFANTIIKLLADDALYHKLQNNARTFVEQNYSWNVFVSELNQAIKKTE
jgi:sugar transferase (PEP-CTERM/EpsH1 system associated)